MLLGRREGDRALEIADRALVAAVLAVGAGQRGKDGFVLRCELFALLEHRDRLGPLATLQQDGRDADHCADARRIFQKDAAVHRLGPGGSARALIQARDPKPRFVITWVCGHQPLKGGKRLSIASGICQLHRVGERGPAGDDGDGR